MKLLTIRNFFLVVLVLSIAAKSSSSKSKGGSSGRSKTGSSSGSRTGSSGGGHSGSSTGSHTKTSSGSNTGGSGKTSQYGGSSDHNSGVTKPPPYNPNFPKPPSHSSRPQFSSQTGSHPSAPSNPSYPSYRSPNSPPGNSHSSMPYMNGQSPHAPSPPGWQIPHQPGSHYPPSNPMNGHYPSAPHIGTGSHGASYPTGSFHPPGSPHGVSYPGSSHTQIHNQPTNIHHHYAPTYNVAPPTHSYVPGRSYHDIDRPTYIVNKGPSFGKVVAGAVVAGATFAAVDYAVNSIFRPNHHHIHTYPSAPVVGTPTSTHTVNNYYYGNSGAGGPNPSNNNNGPNTSEPNHNNSQQNQGSNGATSSATNEKGSSLPITNGVVSITPEAAAQAEKDNPISDTNIMKLTEQLLEAQDKNLYQLVEINLQNKVTFNNNTNEKLPDEASEHLFTLKPELDSIGTVKTLRALYDNYEKDGFIPENLTVERENEEKAFIDEIMKTPIMTTAMNWLVDQKYIEPRESEKKATLWHMWFSTYDNTSSGFERIFLSEKYGTDGIFGMQNWLYFSHLESQDSVNYLGHVDNATLSGKGQLLKLNYLTEGFTIQNATIFVGTPPELEVALYTICFYARPNNWCPISLGGTKFFILTRLFKYFQKDLIDIAFPSF